MMNVKDGMVIEICTTLSNRRILMQKPRIEVIQKIAFPGKSEVENGWIVHGVGKPQPKYPAAPYKSAGL